MRALVTGAAGFVGSNLTDRLLEEGHDVVALDSLTAYCDADIKRANVAGAIESDACEFVQDDLLTCDLALPPDGIDVGIHQAGQPGVLLSWADGCGTFERFNTIATQRLREAVVRHPIDRFVYASSLSVYGVGQSPAIN